MRAVMINQKIKIKKIFCSVPVKIKIVCGRYATARPSARPSPSPSELCGSCRLPTACSTQHAAGGHAARSTLLYDHPLLYAHPPLYKPTRQAGLWVIVGYGFLMTHNNPRGKKPGNKKRGAWVCGSLWVMWAVILNRCRSRVLHRKCSTFFKLRMKISITHNHPQTAQTRMLISFERGSCARHFTTHAQPTLTHKNAVTNCYKYLYKNTLTSVSKSITLESPSRERQTTVQTKGKPCKPKPKS